MVWKSSCGGCKFWVVSLIFLNHGHFIKQKIEKRKIQFLITKRGHKSYLIKYVFLISDTEIVGGLICYFWLIIILSSQKMKNVKYSFLLQKAIENSILQIWPPNCSLIHIILIQNNFQIKIKSWFLLLYETCQ